MFEIFIIKLEENKKRFTKLIVHLKKLAQALVPEILIQSVGGKTAHIFWGKKSPQLILVNNYCSRAVVLNSDYALEPPAPLQ